MTNRNGKSERATTRIWPKTNEHEIANHAMLLFVYHSDNEVHVSSQAENLEFTLIVLCKSVGGNGTAAMG